MILLFQFESMGCGSSGATHNIDVLLLVILAYTSELFGQNCLDNSPSSFYTYTVSQNTVPTYFCSVSVKYKPISIKVNRHVQEETFNKIMQKFPLFLKYVLALPWEIWSHRFSRQRRTYMYILMYHKRGWQLLSQKSYSKLHYLYNNAQNVHFQRELRSQM